MNWLVLVACVAGAGTFALLFTVFDTTTIAASVAACGWGVAVVCLYRLIPLACDVVAWSYLIPVSARPGWRRLALFRWIAKSINLLLPAAQIGGDVVRARLLALAGISDGAAGASVLVDSTINLFAQILFAMLGGIALAVLFEPNQLVGLTVSSILVALAIVVGLLGAQRLGLLPRLAAAIGRLGIDSTAERFAHGLLRLHDRSMSLYRAPLPLIGATCWHLAGWLLRTGETWLALHYMGVAIDLPAALVIESLSSLVRGAAVGIPGGLGAQEAAILLFGSQIGLAPETALALALIKRVQDLVVFGPGLATWWFAERRARRSPMG